MIEWKGSELELNDKREITTIAAPINYYNLPSFNSEGCIKVIITTLTTYKEMKRSNRKGKKKKVQKWKSGTELKVSCRKVKRKRKSQLQKSKKKNKKLVAEM